MTRSRFNKLMMMLLLPVLAACATESNRALTPQSTRASSVAYNGIKLKVALGQFENRTNFMNGVFSTGDDVLGKQARTILKTHLQDSRRFAVLDRRNLEQISRENTFSGTKAKIKGATYLVTGDVVEFGRRKTGDRQLFGILGKGKTQTAYAKVNILLVNTNTSEVVYTAQGAGEFALSNREVIGFGGRSGYDATLTGKVLNLAIREAVDDLVVNTNEVR